MPAMLVVSDATPVASVRALPTALPFNVKATDLPATGELSALLRKVAERSALPPKVPFAAAAVSVVGTSVTTLTVAVAELFAGFGSTAELLLILTVLLKLLLFASPELTWATMVAVAD
jgi:hypothetical protein